LKRRLTGALVELIPEEIHCPAASAARAALVYLRISLGFFAMKPTSQYPQL
jgi:hypothetical protein